RAATPADAAGSNLVGSQLRPGVMPIMRVRTHRPAGIPPAGEVTVAITNNEGYVSSPRARLVPGGTLQLGIVNQDPVARTIQPMALYNRRMAEGANPWGQFDWVPVGAPVVVG